MNIQAQNFQTGQRLTAKDLNDLKNAVMNPNISLGDGLVGSSGNGSITIQRSESLNKKAKEYTNIVWQLKSAPSQRFIHEDSDGNRYPSLYVYVGSTLANAFENINIQNQWIAQGTKPTALYLLNGKESPKCTTYLAEVDEKGAITKGDEVDISLDTAASQTQIDLQSDFYAKDKDIGIDGWLELPVAIADATGTYMCVFEQGPLLVVGLFFCDLTVEQNIESNSQDETNNFVSYSIESNLVDIVSQLVMTDYGWGGMIGNPVPMFSCRPLADYETLKTDFLDNDMIVDFEKFKIISQFRNVQQFQFIDTVSQMPYSFKPVFIRGSVNDPGQDLSSINVGWVLNMIVPEVATPSSYDADGVRDNVYASTSSIRKVPTLESIPKIILPGETPYREIDVRKVYRLTQIGIGGSAIYVAPLISSSGAPDADTFPTTDIAGTFRNEDGQTGGLNPICLGGAIDALIVRSKDVSLPLDDNSKTLLLKCVPVWSLQLGTWIYGFWIEQSSLEALDGFNVGSRNGVKNTDQIVAALLPNTKQAFVGSSTLKNGEKIQFNIGFNKNLKLRPLTPAYMTVDLRNIAAAMPYADSQFINGLKRQNAQYKNMTTVYQSNYDQLSAEMTDNDNQDLGNKLFSRSGSIDYRIIRPGGTNDTETFAKANYPIELMGFGLVPPISVDADRTTPDYSNNITDLSDIIKNDLVIRHYWQDTPGDLTSNTVGQVVDYVNMQSLLSAWTELCCQTSVDISAITDAVLSADNADWQNRYFLKCRVNDDPEDYNYGKVQVFLGKTTSRLDAHCTVGGMPVNYYRDKNNNTLASDDKGWCTLPYSPGSKLYYWIGAEWDSSYIYKYTLYITDVQMIPSNTVKDIVREEGFLYYQNANPNAYAYDLADYTATGDVRKTNIDDASTWANRIYNIHLGDIHCNPFPNEIEPFTFGLGRDGYWKVYEGGDYLVYYNNDSINKHTSMLAVSTPPYGYNSADGWADTGIPLTADVNLYFVFSNGSGNQGFPEWDFTYGSLMPFSNGIRLVAGNSWDGTGIPTEITQYHKGKIFIDYDMGDVDFSDNFNPDTKSYSIERKDDFNDHFTLYQFASTVPTQQNKVLQWSDTEPEDIDDSLQFAVKAVGAGTNTLEYIIPLVDAGRVNDLSAALAELSGNVPTPGDIEQLLYQLSADIIDSTDGKYWHLGNQSTSEAYGSVIGNSNQDTVIDLDHLMLDGSDWTVMNSFMVNGNLDVHNDCNLYGTLYYDYHGWQSAPINIGDDFMTILVASDIGDPETIINAIENGIQKAIAWSNAVAASSYGTYQGVLNAIGNATQAAQNAQNAANAAQGAANAAQASVNALNNQINGANGIDARLSAAESNVTSLDTRYNLLSGDVDTIGNQLNVQGQAIHDIADAISGDIVPAINNISSVVNNNVTQITNIDGRVTNIENNYTTVTNNISTLSTDVGTLSSGLSSAQSSIDSINQNKADISALNDLSDSLSNYVEKYTTEVQTISTPLVNLQPLSAFELNAAYGNDAVGIFKPYGTVALNNYSGDKTILYPARTVTERVGGRPRQVYHTPEIASYKASTSATYTLKVPYENGTIATKENLSAEISAKADLSALSDYLSAETDPIFNDWLSADNVAAGKDSGVSATAAYDCAVEWLQTDGTAYIDTGIVGTNSLKVEINFDEDPSTTMDGIALPFGARTSATSNIFGLRYAGQNFSSTPGRFSLDYNTQTGKIVQNQSTTRPILVKVGKAMPTYSNVLLATNGEQWVTPVVDFESGLNNYLFACNSNGTAVVRGTGATVLSRIYYCKIWNNTVLVRDFIPVRKNGVGYMFDRVSKTLFGNIAGSGAFTYGSDAEAQNITTAVAIGKDAVATDNALQLGNGTNDAPKSFYIGNALLLDQNGNIQKESLDPDFLQNLNLKFGMVNTNFQNIETAIGSGWKETANLTVGSLASGFSFSTDGTTWNNKVRFFHWGQMGFIVGSVRRSSALAAGTVYGSIGKIPVPSGFSFMAAGGSNGDHRTTMAIAASGSVSICPVTAIAANSGISIRGFIPVGTINDKYQKRYVSTL